MADSLKLVEPLAGDALHDYPPEHLYVRWAAPAAVGFHLLVVATVLIFAYVQHIRSLREMMTASVPDIPIEQIQVILIDDKKPPPPTNNPLWIKQLIIPKVKPPPPPPPPPKPKPKPQAVHLVPKLVVGSNNLPVPTYPPDAYYAHVEGTVMLRVSFDGNGGVADAEVVSSSGSTILDSGARHYVLDHWKSAAFAGQVQTVPIQYTIAH